MRRAALLYGLFVLVVFARFVFLGEVYLPGDFLSFIYPWRAYRHGFPHNIELLDLPILFYPGEVFLNHSIKGGIIPLWNPHLFSGHPIVASGQSGFLYPPRLLLHYLFSPAVARTWMQMLHLFGAGMAMNWFLRVRGFKENPCLLGGLVWMGNSFITSWMEYEHVVIASFYLALLLVCLEKGIREGRSWWFLMPVLGGLSLHSGHLQHNMYTGLIFIVYSLIRLAGRKNPTDFLLFGLIGILTAGVAAPTIAPALQLLSESQRIPLVLKDNAAPLWSLLLSLFSPDVWGNPTRGFMLNRCQTNLIYSEFACFAGVIPLGLTLLARGKEARLLQGLSVICLLLASATFGLSLPFLGRFIPGRILHALMFCITLGATIGAQQVEEEERPCRLVGLGLGIAWAVAFCFILYYLNQPERVLAWWKAHPDGIKLPPMNVSDKEFLSAFEHTYSWNPQLLLPFLSCGALAFWSRRTRVLIGFTALELVLFASGYNPSVPPSTLYPETPEIRAMSGAQGRVVAVDCANGNTLTPYGLSLVNGYESIVPARYYMALTQAEPDRALNMRIVALHRLDLPMIDALSVQYALFPPRGELKADGWEPVLQDEGGKVYRNSQALPRALLLGAVRPLTALEQLQSFQPAQEAFVSKAPPPDLAPGQGAVTWVEDSPNTVILDVETATTQLLLLTDAYDSGWRCRVDGKETEIFPANLCSRGIYLEAGRHRVEYRFDPPSFRYGLWAMELSFLLTLVLGILFSRTPREEKEDESHE